MLRFLSIILLSMIVMPAMAEQSLSPMQVETLPFDGNVALNTTPITQEIDMSAEVEGTVKEKAGLPQFDITTFSSQIFWLAVMFAILYVYFSKFALPKLSSTIENRHATIKADLEQAEKISLDVDKTRADYEAAMQKAHDDARTTIADVETHLRNDAETQANDFKEKSAKSIADLEAKAETAKDKIKAELDDVAANVTNDIITKLTSLSLSDKDILKAVSKYTETKTAATKKKAA